MPTIARYDQPKVQSELVRQPQKSAALPQGSFGEGIAQGVSAVADLGLQVADRISTTKAEEAIVGFEKAKNAAFYDPESGYFNTQGRNAFDSAADMTKSIDKLKRQYGDSLDAVSKSKFDSVANKHIARANVDIQRHAASGFKAWEVATIESKVENTIENASLYYNDPDLLRVQRALGERAVLDSAEMMGIGSEATNERLQTFNSAFAKSIITSSLAESSASAKESMDKYGSQLEGPDRTNLTKAIDAKAKVEKSKSDAGIAVLTAGRLVDQYETRGEMMTEIDRIEDPELRKKTRIEVSAQLSQRDRAKTELQKDSYHKAIGMVNSGLSASQIESEDPQAWHGMSSVQRNNILSNKHMINDHVLFNKLVAMTPKQKAELDANSYADKLTPSYVEKLQKEINSAKKGKSGSRVQSLSSKTMDAARTVFGKKTGWSDGSGKPTKKGKLANDFISSLQNAIDEVEEEKGVKITPAEENKLISEFTNQILIEKSLFGFDILASDIKLDLSNTPANDIRTLNRVIENTPSIDLDDLVSSYQFLVSKGIEVSPETLAKVYQQGTK